ncbi:10645_t:CDS:2, partial [Paraglomus occultum]
AVTIAQIYPKDKDDDTPLAPLISSQDAEIIPDKYIVVFKTDITADQISCHHNRVNTALFEERKKYKRGFMTELISGIEHVYNLDGFQGYSGTFSKDVLNHIRQSDDIAYVEKDHKVYADVIQYDAPWGLARVSHRDRLQWDTYNRYLYDQTAGEGITAYVIDTGIYINNTDFDGRARWGVTIPWGEPNIDNVGHGTHVAGTIAGTRFGVAKNARLVAVKVLGQDGGTVSDVIKGIEWTVRDHRRSVNEARRAGRQYKGSVANMSLGGAKSYALDRAANAAVDNGVVLVVAAGNSNADACTQSPSGAAKAISVAASTIRDERAGFSNYGRCVALFGPGQDILSTWIGYPTATKSISGTSMASPHVAGLAAYLLSLSPSPLSPTALRNKLIALATRNALVDVKGSPNLLAYNGII